MNTSSMPQVALVRPLPGHARRDAAWRLRRIRSFVQLLDSAFEIPGTRWRIGFDGIVGLIPGVGDLVTTAVSLWILREARELGVGRAALARMAWNVAIDCLGGAVPLAGDVFDVAWKANSKNLALLERDLARQGFAAVEPRADASRSDTPAGGFSPASGSAGGPMEPRITTAAIVAAVAAIVSFTTGPFWGLVLSVVALLAGSFGMLLAMTRTRRGAIVSFGGIVLGAIAFVRALLDAVF